MHTHNDIKSKVIRLVLILIISLAGLVLKADPWYCSGLISCNYYPISSPRYLCQGESIEIFARTPSPNILYKNPPCTNPTYQWQRQVGEPGGIAYWQNMGVSTNNITINVQGLYRCVVGCTGGGYNTSTARIYISTSDVSVTGEPSADEVCLGEYASFQVQASGDDQRFQWQQLIPGGSWTNMAGEDNKNLYFIPDSADHLSQFKCHVSNGCNDVYSTGVQLTVDMPTEIFFHPANDSVCENTAAGFNISTGGSDLVFMWQEKDTPAGTWTDLSSSGNYEFDQEAGNLTIKSASAGLQGYSYRAIISGQCDPKADTSSPAILVIKDPPSFTTQPVNDTACSGENAYFEILAKGTGSLSYKWQKGGKTVKDWSSENFLLVEEVSLDDNEDIQVMISDECFSTSNPVSSDLARLIVLPPPFVNLGDDQRICEGSSYTLNAGNDFISYVWSTGDSLQTIEVSEQGSYSVTVEDLDGCTASDAIFIITDTPVPGIDIGTDSSICSGDEITFTAASGYDWYKWSDGSTGTSLKVSSTSSIWVSAGNNNTVCEARDSVNILVSEPFDQSKLCLVTIDESTGKYLIIWERTPDEGIYQYNLYREGNWIGSIAYDDLSLYLDMEADPETRPYRYEMTITDTCGNESGFTPYHIPIFLQFTGFIDGVNLSWSKYQIEEAEVKFNSYSVYKGSDSLQLSPLEENIPPEVSVYIDKDLEALNNKYFYRIAGILSEPCNPSGGNTKAGTEPYHHSLSNMDENKLKTSVGSIIEETGELSIYPNPAREIVTLRFRNPSSAIYTLQIFNVSGKVVKSLSPISGEETKFSVSDLKAGYYYLRLSGQNYYYGNLVIK